MFHKVSILQEQENTLSEAEVQLLYNAWDNELLQLMLAAEKTLSETQEWQDTILPSSRIMDEASWHILMDWTLQAGKG